MGSQGGMGSQTDKTPAAESLDRSIFLDIWLAQYPQSKESSMGIGQPLKLPGPQHLLCRITHWCMKFVYCVTMDLGHFQGQVAISKPNEWTDDESILFNPYILVRNVASVFCFLSSLSLLLPASTAVFGFYLSSFYATIPVQSCQII